MIPEILSTPPCCGEFTQCLLFEYKWWNDKCVRERVCLFVWCALKPRVNEPASPAAGSCAADLDLPLHASHLLKDLFPRSVDGICYRQATRFFSWQTRKPAEKREREGLTYNTERNPDVITFVSHLGLGEQTRENKLFYLDIHFVRCRTYNYSIYRFPLLHGERCASEKKRNP